MLKSELGKLITSYKPPIDSADLKAILLEGLIPSAEEMLDYLNFD